LNAVKISLNAVREYLYGTCLCQARRTFYKNVSIGKQCDEKLFNQFGLTDNLRF
jgi:hypothetical protein